MGCGYSKGASYHYSPPTSLPSSQHGGDQFLFTLLLIFLGSLVFMFFNRDKEPVHTTATTGVTRTSKTKQPQEITNDDDSDTDEEGDDGRPSSDDGLTPDRIHVKYS